MHELAAFHFLRPWWLLALFGAVVMALLAARARLKRSSWDAVIDSELHDALIERALKKSGTLKPVLTGFALAIASIALAGPTWQRLPQPIDQKTDALVIVLDLSLSMYATDVAPSRLVQARHVITDILRRRTEGYTGLVAYAGDAHTVSPLTDDTRTIENMLAALAPDMMPIMGSNPRQALQLARTLMSNAGMSQGRLLLVTDGVDHIVDVSMDASPNFPISILGVGTAAGAPIPLGFVDQPGRVLTDRGGNTIIAKLDTNSLRSLAQMCNGRYANAAAANTDIENLLTTPLPNADDARHSNRKFDLWADYGYWLVLLLIPFALLNFRRGAALLLVCALVPPPAHASWWSNLWRTPDQQGYQALQQDQPKQAAKIFSDPQWQGVADYRSGAYADADHRFSADPSPNGSYNRGNALAKQRKYPEAIQAYDEALRAAPGDKDAAFNKALIEKLLQQQQQSRGNSNQQSQRNRSQSKSGQSHDQSASHDDGSDSQQGNPDDRATKQNRDAHNAQNKDKPDADRKQEMARRDQPQNEMRDEERDSLERWLRRVPDDPAGLLRRKFQYESNQRLRNGAPDSPDQEHIW